MSKLVLLLESNVFSLAISFNMFSMTLYLIALSLIGEFELAADIAVIQGALMAVFLAFSANARNLILAGDMELLTSQFYFRSILIVPLSVIVYFLSNVTVEASSFVIVLFIIRRCAEWLAELHISEREVAGDTVYALYFSLLQFVTLLLLITLQLLGKESILLVILALWAVAPILQSFRFIIKMFKCKMNVSIHKFLPHLGSTWAVGISTYVFRVLVILLAGRVMGGMLVSAYAIGGMLNSLYTYALGPSQALKDELSGKSRSVIFVKITVSSLLSLGLCLVGYSFIGYWGNVNTHLFIQTIGFSMMGAGLMIIAQRRRINMIQHLNSSVFVPDVLSNIFLVATIPFIFYEFGVEGLSVLFLWSAVLALILYMLQGWKVVNFKEIKSGSVSEIEKSFIWKQTLILMLFFMPVFFQLSGGIFDSQMMYFDSQGQLKNLPLPLASIMCFVGIAVLINFERVRISTLIVFSVFVAMFITMFVAASRESADYGVGKIILLMQFILPVFALVLGQCYRAPAKSQVKFEAIILWVLCIIVPAELIASAVQGRGILTPYLYVFSLYQHLQYLPALLTGMYILSVSALFEERKFRFVILTLAPFMGIYAIASASMLAMAIMTLGCVWILLLLASKERNIKRLSYLFLLLVLGSMFLYGAAANNKLLDAKIGASKQQSQEMQSQEMQVPSNLSERFRYWRIYWKGLTASPEIFLFGNTSRPDRASVPSAHNYYLDFMYNFGFLGILPIFIAMGYTILLLYRRVLIGKKTDLMTLGGLVLFYLIVDNFLKVGLRQPYPGMIMFFLWGVLLSRLAELKIENNKSN